MSSHSTAAFSHNRASVASSSTSSSARIDVSPSSCLMDEPVTVRVSGLQENEIYTLQSSVRDCKDVPFVAVAHYKSDGRGEIDLTRTPALGGHYSGLFPMGPFAAILPISQKLKDPRFSFRDVTKPQTFELSVHEGAIGYQLLMMSKTGHSPTPLCRVEHHRHLLADGCQRLPVRYGKVRGMLHLPPGSGPFPGVVDMFGSAGGLMEHRSALLAARGVAALSLAFFNYEDLPVEMNPLNLEYFQEAVQFLLSRDEVSKAGVGAIGTSKGGDIVLDMACAIPDVKVAVVINGGCHSAECAMHVNGEPLRAPLGFDISRAMVDQDLRVDCLHMTDETFSLAEPIPVERISGHVLWVVGADDRNWPSAKFAELAAQRYMKHHPHDRDKFQVLKYKGAGHLIEPPYVPFCDVSYHRVISGSMLWGGNAVDHTDAQVHSWRTMIDLFHDKLLPRSTVTERDQPWAAAGGSSSLQLTCTVPPSHNSESRGKHYEVRDRSPWVIDHRVSRPSAITRLRT